jgi:outer membrane protein
LRLNTKHSLEKGRQLEAEINRFKQDASNFSYKHKLNGQEWSQKAWCRIKKRTRIRYAQQALAQQLQQQMVLRMDSVVSGVKKSNKELRKKRRTGTLIYGTNLTL